MNLFQSVTSNVTKAVDFVVDKNRKAALINRIRIVIKNERENESRAYVALGKYYYEHLRDKENEETEHLCRAIDYSDKRMKKAFAKLDEITEPEGCSDCGDDCDYCSYYEETEEEADRTAPADHCDESNPSVSCIIDKANESFSAAFADSVNEEAADDEKMHPEL